MVPCGSSPVAHLYLAKTEAPEEEAVPTTLLKCTTMTLMEVPAPLELFFFFCDVNMFCVLI